MAEKPQKRQTKAHRQNRSENRGDDSGGAQKITQREVEDIEELSSPRSPVIYEIVRRHGEEEMARPVVSLWWSGVAAGLSISFSLLAQAILQTHLPDAPWRPLIANLGYSAGFVMVVMSRQQLFTETTVTAVLPVMAAFSLSSLGKLARMWSVVLIANFAGTLFAALFCKFTPVLTPDLFNGMIEISRHILGHSLSEMFFRGIAAGFLMAAMVWLIPSAESAQFYVIVLMTYLISAGSFMHIIAGSVEAFLLVLDGQVSWLAMLGQFAIPTLLGNIVGGTALFALIAYAQVMKEI
ncbi:MAG: formate/nitrite transporter family protein [Xanthobacteraceae bacterium]